LIARPRPSDVSVCISSHVTSGFKLPSLIGENRGRKGRIKNNKKQNNKNIEEHRVANQDRRSSGE
jgi:hypothetical protein